MPSTPLPFLLLLLLSATPLSSACGMVTHANIARRASLLFNSSAFPQYRGLLLTHVDALVSGAPFPDWGYDCGPTAYHNISESTHWQPFQVHAVRYVHMHYPPPWDEATQKLVVFLLGTSSHYIADLLWHGLGQAAPLWSTPTARGFLRSLGGTNYACNGTLCSRAHSAGDAGGEFMVDYQLDQGWLPTKWYLPSKDVLGIYELMALPPVNRTIMEGCFVEFYVAAMAEKYAGFLLYPLFAAKSPFLADRMQDWPVGGIDDNAIWTTWKWDLVISWLENATALPHDGEILRLRREPIVRSLLERAPQLLKAAGIELDVDKVMTSRGLSVSHRVRRTLSRPDTAPLVEEAAARCLAGEESFCLQRDWLRTMGGPIATTAPTSTLTRAAPVPYSYFGRGMAQGDFDGDGLLDLAVGAPGWGKPGQPHLGAVYVYSNWSAGAGGGQDVVTLYGRGQYSDFGHTLVACDMSGSGVKDVLCVSAPIADSNYTVGEYAHNAYRGSVTCFFDSLRSNVTITAPGRMLNDTVLGRSLLCADLTGDGVDDLVIGSPNAGNTAFAPPNPYSKGETLSNRGMVAMFEGGSALLKQGRVSVANASLTLWGSSDFGLFGESLAVETTSATLVVGSPEFQQAAGRIDGYHVERGGSGWRAVPAFQVTTNATFSNFGRALAIGDPYAAGEPYIFVGAPITTPASSTTWLRQSGAVYSLPLAKLSGNTTLEGLRAAGLIRTELTGSYWFGRLGARVALHNSTLVVAMPTLTTLKAHEAGAVAVVQSVPDGSVPIAKAAKHMLQTDAARARLGSGTALLVTGDDKTQVLVAAPRDTQNGAEGQGSVNIFEL